MKNLALVILFIIHGCNCYAQLPPTTLKGQRDSNAATTFNYQVPFNQSTRTAGTNALIETGNKNLLRNSGFEATTFSSNWTASGGSLTSAENDPNEVLYGNKHAIWDSNAASQTLTSDLVTIPPGLRGREAEVSCLMQTGLSVGTYLLQALDGSGNILASVPIVSLDQRTLVISNFIAPSTAFQTFQLRVIAQASNEPPLIVDDCYLGEARNLSQVSQASFVGGMEQAGASGCIYSESTSSGPNNWVDLGTASGCNAWTTSLGVTAQGTNDHRAVFNNMPPGYYTIVVNGLFYMNATGTCNFRLNDGTNTYQSQSIVFNGSGGVPVLVFHVPYTSAANRTFRLQAADSIVGSCSFDNQVVGQTASWKFYRFPSGGELAVRADQTNYGWTAYTPTFTAFGTVTNTECQHSRDNEDILLACKFTCGTTVASEARISLPGSLVSANTTKIPSIRQAGLGTRGSGGAAGTYQVLIEPSTSYVTVAVNDATTSGFTKVNGSALCSSGQSFGFLARLPINGWVVNNNATIFQGSVTSISSGSTRTEAANVTCSAASSIVSQSNALSAIGNRSSASCALTINNGVFSAAPWSCQVTINGTAAASTACQCSSATSCTIYGPSAADFNAYVQIQGAL